MGQNYDPIFGKPSRAAKLLLREIPLANVTTPVGLVSNTAQSIAGVKTFFDDITRQAKANNSLFVGYSLNAFTGAWLGGFYAAGVGYRADLPDVGDLIIGAHGTEYLGFATRGLLAFRPIVFYGDAVTVTSGFGTSPSVVGNNARFRLNVGTGGTANTGVVAINGLSGNSIVQVTTVTSTPGNIRSHGVLDNGNATLTITANAAWASGTILHVSIDTMFPA